MVGLPRSADATDVPAAVAAAAAVDAAAVAEVEKETALRRAAAAEERPRLPTATDFVAASRTRKPKKS